MATDFIISGIQKAEIQHLFSLSNEELTSRGITRMTVDEYPGYPCRLSLEDAPIGEEVLAFNYEHHAIQSPYRASGPVFVRLNQEAAQLEKNEIPAMLLHRYLSLRVYDDHGMMIDATTVVGEHLEDAIQTIFRDPAAKYIQVHNARPGCYNCQVDRIPKGPGGDFLQ
ncbi:DUF1203 domain-containing protein [Lewinella sp. W8]|uniref:DUF1203 domain-containing protein n=1 Tax=Lewinella sp. W8 TaxID=2528208 RepID=UPI0010686263|nr:DUF1203 domain-containing protein [Lewinella sp. W8]MTB52071.1 DUF1203 domain-containing protein [Lewinella sp. W8]